jgi:hypothetical protein
MITAETKAKQQILDQLEAVNKEITSLGQQLREATGFEQKLKLSQDQTLLLSQVTDLQVKLAHSMQAEIAAIERAVTEQQQQLKSQVESKIQFKVGSQS